MQNVSSSGIWSSTLTLVNALVDVLGFHDFLESVVYACTDL